MRILCAGFLPREEARFGRSHAALLQAQLPEALRARGWEQDSGPCQTPRAKLIKALVVSLGEISLVHFSSLIKQKSPETYRTNLKQ